MKEKRSGFQFSSLNNSFQNEGNLLAKVQVEDLDNHSMGSFLMEMHNDTRSNPNFSEQNFNLNSGLALPKVNQLKRVSCNRFAGNINQSDQDWEDENEDSSSIPKNDKEI